MNPQRKKSKRRTWEHPWGYRESFMMVLELALLGLILEVLTGGRGAPVLGWPANLIAGTVFILLLSGIYFSFRRHPFVNWLSSVPAAVSSITLFAFSVLLLGFIPQGDALDFRYLHLMGFTHMKQSWLMLFSGFFFLLCLGITILRRSAPLNRRNLGFLLNHAGLWLAISAAYLGSGDLVRLQLATFEEEQPVNLGMEVRTQQVHELPFSVYLKDFEIETYNPKMALVNGTTGRIIGEKGKTLIRIDEGLKTVLMDWDIEIRRYLPDARRKGDRYIFSDSTGSAPAAFVHAMNRLSGEKRSGWISCGSYLLMQQYLRLDQDRYLVMIPPEPRRYTSDIVISGQEGEKLQAVLEVNEPYTYQGWKLYQLSYNERMGKWSNLSVIEAVKDPWLPVVYTGIFLLLGGSAYLFWKGREYKTS